MIDFSLDEINSKLKPSCIAVDSFEIKEELEFNDDGMLRIYHLKFSMNNTKYKLSFSVDRPIKDYQLLDKIKIEIVCKIFDSSNQYY